MLPKQVPIPQLLETLKSGDVYQRREAARQLTIFTSFSTFQSMPQFKNPDEKQAVKDAFSRAFSEDDDLQVRGEAAVGLEVMGVFSELEFLEIGLKLAEQGEFTPLGHGISPGWPGSLPRQYTLDALKVIGERAVPGLGRLLNEDDTIASEYAASSLGVLGYRSAVEPLTRALKNVRSETRSAATYALTKIGDPSAIPALQDAMKNLTGIHDVFESVHIHDAITEIQKRQG